MIPANESKVARGPLGLATACALAIASCGSSHEIAFHIDLSGCDPGADRIAHVDLLLLREHPSNFWCIAQQLTIEVNGSAALNDLEPASLTPLRLYARVIDDENDCECSGEELVLDSTPQVYQIRTISRCEDFPRVPTCDAGF